MSSYSWPSSGQPSNIGSNGLPIPTYSGLIGAENPSLNLVPLQVDASGNLLVNVAAGTITALNPSVSLIGNAVPTYGTFISAKNGSGNLSPILTGSQLSAVSLAVVIASDQTVPVSFTSPVNKPNPTGSFSAGSISSVTTITVPTNAVGFLLEVDSANTDFMRWCAGATASASNGMKLEPGRDTGYIPLAANISICPNSGTQAYTIQWVINQ